MRKVIKFISTLIALIFGFQFAYTSPVYANSLVSPALSHQPPEQSTEELYQDIFISLLLPYIQKEVDRFTLI